MANEELLVCARCGAPLDTDETGLPQWQYEHDDGEILLSVCIVASDDEAEAADCCEECHAKAALKAAQSWVALLDDDGAPD